MFSIYAAYRGRSQRRGTYVRNLVETLRQSPSVECVELRGVEDFVCITAGPEETGAIVMSLLQAGDFSLGIGTVLYDYLFFHDPDEREYPESFEDTDDSEDTQAIHAELMAVAMRSLPQNAKAGSVYVRVEEYAGKEATGKAAEVSEDIVSAFTLLSHILTRRTKEGREATALLRSGHLQSEAAEELGISKQAMSQRLAAAGWAAEQAGWTLAVHMLARIEEYIENPL